MALTQGWTLYAIKIDATMLKGVQRVAGSPGITASGEPVGGEVYPRFNSISAVAPSFTASTMAVAQGLTLVPAIGTSIAGLAAGLTFYGYKLADGGSRASGSVHRSFAAAKGLLVPRRLTVRHQEHAVLELEAILAHNSADAGVNDILTIVDTAAVPTAPVDDERFTLGPITIGGLALPQVRSVEIDFGIQVRAEGADSDLHPTFVYIERIAPTIRIAGVDPTWIADAMIPYSTEDAGAPLTKAFSKAGTHANSTIFLRARTQGGTYVADASASHIKLTADGMLYAASLFEAESGGMATSGLEMRLRYDGTNAPLVVTPAQAIA